jgi:hypothetical protein
MPQKSYRAPRRYTCTAGVRHLFAAYELGEDKLYGHIKPRKTRARFLESWGAPSSSRSRTSSGCWAWWFAWAAVNRARMVGLR